MAAPHGPPRSLPESRPLYLVQETAGNSVKSIRAKFLGSFVPFTGSCSSRIHGAVKTKLISSVQTAAAIARPEPTPEATLPTTPFRAANSPASTHPRTQPKHASRTDLKPHTEPGSEVPVRSLCGTVRAARERFLSQHGPAATRPRPPLTSREFRKALVAAEMARWDCY